MFKTTVIEIARLCSLTQDISYIRVCGTSDEWNFDSVRIPTEFRNIPIIKLEAENNKIIMYVSCNDIPFYYIFKSTHSSGHLNETGGPF